MKITTLMLSLLALAGVAQAESTKNIPENGVLIQVGSTSGYTGFYALSLVNAMVTPGEVYDESITFENKSVVRGSGCGGCDITPVSITFNSERQRSQDVVRELQSSMAANGILWVKGNAIDAGDSSDGLPGELNFALQVNAIVNAPNGYEQYTCNSFYLAQGSDGAGVNNWWIFSNNNDQNRTITCGNMKYKIQASSLHDEDGSFYMMPQ